MLVRPPLPFRQAMTTSLEKQCQNMTHKFLISFPSDSQCINIKGRGEGGNPKREEMLGKTRKVSARGEGVGANYAFGFGAWEDDAIIKQRLVTRTTTTRGEPPLKKLQKKFSSLVWEVEKEEDNYKECEKLGRAFLQELTTFEIPLLKSKRIVEANVREKENFNELKEEMNRQILEAERDIEDLKKCLEESKVERRHKEECEAIRKLISLQPPRSHTLNLISIFHNQISSLDSDNTSSSRLLDLRKKQFALFLHIVDELQNTIEEEQKSLVEEMRMATEELKNGMDDTSAGVETMTIDQ
ncbi:hypothetical protein VNO78_15492 [Psophocarpus tetragonolobus]|uniref:Uncharacterized protein n=1 Tax=Psophocarpus tetragonolobus TaxID=3891 RepID=A0AAN9SEP4_PSOTE